jgi:uncharacterized protein
MKSRSHSPRKLDLAVFAREGEHLEGEWPALSLERLADAAAPETPASAWPAVVWQLDGEQRQPKGAQPQTWLRVRAEAKASLTCQRCLKPVTEALNVDRWLRFVDDENLAAELDADSDDDVLALPRHLDAQELIEDELLLALPLVPRHERCPEPLALAAEDPSPEDDRPNPFAALAALKRDA